MNLCLEGPGARMAAVTQETACPWEGRTHLDPCCSPETHSNQTSQHFHPYKAWASPFIHANQQMSVYRAKLMSLHILSDVIDSHIRKGSVVSTALQTEPDLSAALSAGTPGVCLTLAWSFPHGPRAAALVSPARLQHQMYSLAV